LRFEDLKFADPISFVDLNNSANPEIHYFSPNKKTTNFLFKRDTFHPLCEMVKIAICDLGTSTLKKFEDLRK
jgi:hypothetical protein